MLPEETAATSIGSPSYHETSRPHDAMSVDDEPGTEASAAASDVLSSDDGGQGNVPSSRLGMGLGSGKMRALTVRGSEFEIPSTSHLGVSAFPPLPRGVARRATSIHLVPRLQGMWTLIVTISCSSLTSLIADSWKVLPRLGARMADGHYSVVPPPHDEDWIAWWEALTNTNGSNTSEHCNADRHLHSHVEPPAEQERPPSQIFTVSDEVQRIVHATRELFDEISLIKEQMETGTRLHNRQSREILCRRPSDPQQSIPGDEESSIIHLEDLSSIFVALGEVYSVLTQFSRAFECILAVPVNWEALSNLLAQIQQLQDLYKVSWEHFASLEEDVRPLRAEMQRIRYAVAQVQEQLDGISNDAVSACEPLIHNFYRQIDTRLSRLENGSGGPSSSPLPPQLGDMLKMFTRLSERVEQLERAAEADDFRTRIDGYIAGYLAERGLHEHVLRQLGNCELTASSSTSAGSSISHVFQAAHHRAPLSVGSFATSVAASTLSTTFPSASLEYTHGAVSAPAGIRQLEHPLNVAANSPAPSAPLPSGGGSVILPGNVTQFDLPAHVHTEAAGVGEDFRIPQSGSRSVLSKMHGKTRGGASSTRRRGG